MDLYCCFWLNYCCLVCWFVVLGVCWACCVYYLLVGFFTWICGVGECLTYCDGSFVNSVGYQDFIHILLLECLLIARFCLLYCCVLFGVLCYFLFDYGYFVFCLFVMLLVCCMIYVMFWNVCCDILDCLFICRGVVFALLGICVWLFVGGFWVFWLLLFGCYDVDYV